MKTFKVRKGFNDFTKKWEMTVKFEGYIPTFQEWEEIKKNVNIEKLPKKKWKIINI